MDAMHGRGASKGFVIATRVDFKNGLGDPVRAVALGLKFPLVGEVVDAIKRDRRDDGGIDILEAGLILRVVGTEADHCGQMSAGTPPRGDDEVWVAPVVGDFRSNPGDDPFYVDEVVWPCGSGAEPVVASDTNPTLLSEVVH